MRRLGTGIALLLAFSAVKQVRGERIFFNDRSAFDAVTGGGLNFESFESVFSDWPAVSFAGFSLSETAGAPNNIFSWDSAEAASFGLSNATTDGNRIAASAAQSSSVYTFQFNNPLNAFGVDVTKDNVATATVGGNLSNTFSLAADTPRFFGAIDDTGTFQTVTFSFSTGADLGFDAVSFGTVVPEPCTFVGLFSMAAMGLFAYYRRRGAPPK